MLSLLRILSMRALRDRCMSAVDFYLETACGFMWMGSKLKAVCIMLTGRQVEMLPVIAAVVRNLRNAVERKRTHFLRLSGEKKNITVIVHFDLHRG